MKKSIMSKKGSCLSFLLSACKDESTVELMRISMKKEADRKDKLEKLLQKYDQIHAIERQHVKSIKANIIQLKDVVSVPKVRFLVDPNIYVDNNLSIETREFLCMLLNTFYKRYQQNTDYQKEAALANDNIKALLKSIANNEELLFKVQKSNINSQVQMEGELLSEKAKLKELNAKTKELQTQEKRVRAIWIEKKEEYDKQKANIDALKEIMNDIESKIIGLTQKINEGEEIRQGNQQKISGQLVYQLKFQEEVAQLKQAVAAEYKRQSILKKKIREKCLKIAKIKGQVNYDLNRHHTDIKLLELRQPRQSTKWSGMKQILQIQKSFERAMSKTNSTMLKSQP